MQGFHEIVRKDKIRPNIRHAIIENGKIIATDGHCLAVVPVDTIADDLEGYSEGKAFSYELLKELGKSIYKEIRFTEKTVQAFKKFGSKDAPDFESLYSATLIDKNSKRFATISKDGSVNESDCFNYPNWEAVIPTDYGNEVNQTVFNPQILARLGKVFNTDSEAVVLEFTGSASSAIKVTPVHEGKPSAENHGYGIIMPMILEG